MEITNEEIGNRIRELRKERGLTQEQLAELAEISVDFLSLVETGRNSMKAQILAKIATSLNISSDYILFGNAPYKENVKLNSMLSAVPEGKRKQVEKLIVLFLDTLNSDNKEKTIKK